MHGGLTHCSLVYVLFFCFFFLEQPTPHIAPNLRQRQTAHRPPPMAYLCKRITMARQCSDG
ncbi:uncharacterized protein LY79DRAFT_536391 [Colletotrichum navitas]|uniref:Secreted protein n=1 Tax=Colletotrichum navitas TaxID=681940 RepID=A0AAD8QAE6_9PEZI|nr:uncharacterized protein LY79DRAFT_536391 [Colletotrichum navitas]KAK1598912.1 hypothetical protein LY79DRAFT_536391 [Colletotrichum navitas]